MNFLHQEMELELADAADLFENQIDWSYSDYPVRISSDLSCQQHHYYLRNCCCYYCEIHLALDDFSGDDNRWLAPSYVENCCQRGLAEALEKARIPNSFLNLDTVERRMTFNSCRHKIYFLPIHFFDNVFCRLLLLEHKVYIKTTQFIEFDETFTWDFLSQ